MSKRFLLLIIGLALVIVSGVWGIKTTLFLLDAERATATITAVRNTNSTCRQTRRQRRRTIETRYDCTIFTAEFEYRTDAGQLITFERGAGSVRGHGQPVSRARFTAAQSVGVLYRPDRPDKPSLDEFAELWGGSLLTAIAGFIFIPFGLIALVRRGTA